MNIIQIKINIFTIALFLVLLRQDYFVYSTTQRILNCFREIESLYVPRHTQNISNLDRKPLCKIAFLHFRYSNIPEKDTFTSVTHAIKEDAKAYFEHMCTVIHPRRKMKDPILFCNQKGLVPKPRPDGSMQTEERICLNQFLDLGAPVVGYQHKDEILKWLFKNVEIDELFDGPKNYFHVWNYVNHVATFFQPEENEMKLPWHFCATRYPETQIEEEIKS